MKTKTQPWGWWWKCPCEATFHAFEHDTLVAQQRHHQTWHAEQARQMMERADRRAQARFPEYCGRGPCSSLDGHEGDCTL